MIPWKWNESKKGFLGLCPKSETIEWWMNILVIFLNRTFVTPSNWWISTSQWSIMLKRKWCFELQKLCGKEDAVPGNRFNSSFNIIQSVPSTQIPPDFSKQLDNDHFWTFWWKNNCGHHHSLIIHILMVSSQSQVVFYKGTVRWVRPLLFPNSPLCDRTNTKNQTEQQRKFLKGKIYEH